MPRGLFIAAHMSGTLKSKATSRRFSLRSHARRAESLLRPSGIQSRQLIIELLHGCRLLL